MSGLLNAFGSIISTAAQVVKGVTASQDLKTCNQKNSSLGAGTNKLIDQINKAQADFKASDQAIQMQIQLMMQQVNEMNAQIQQANQQLLDVQTQLQSEQETLNNLTAQLNNLNTTINDLISQKQYLEALPECQKQNQIIGLQAITFIVFVISVVTARKAYVHYQKLKQV